MYDLGMVMSMYSLLAENNTPTAQDIEDHFDGNICRCTGYRPILSAMKSVCKCKQQLLQQHCLYYDDGVFSFILLLPFSCCCSFIHSLICMIMVRSLSLSLYVSVCV